MAEQHDLTDEQCDRLVALTMDKLAAKNGIHALDLCDSLTNHHSLRRSIVRAAHMLGKQAATPEPAPLTDEQCDRAIAELGLDYLAKVANNRAVLRNLCRRAHDIGQGKGASK